MREFFTADRHPELFLDAYLNPDKPVDWDKLYEGFDAAVGWPTVAFVDRLMDAYPNAKVILTARDVDSWYQSFKKTVHKFSLELNKRDDLPKYMQEWRKLNKALILDGALADPERFNDEEAIKFKYNAHVEWVKKNVPSERLFVMELGEGWERLCKFLDVPVPDVPYPSVNSTNDFVANIMDNMTIEDHIEKARNIDALAIGGV
ncbi:hypothetical protein LRAMOSA10870 [Lichtheimia ramosa]|uniref:Sulfotransferase domain-containing protein n=1 Tax=Lichtheimia ramosa TaxID=688394 RepID=A0A077WQ72_9FUNG|nr:hypothetical protein LRAMOSA10870 [Lichtheimia ramosa]